MKDAQKPSDAAIEAVRHRFVIMDAGQATAYLLDTETNRVNSLRAATAILSHVSGEQITYEQAQWMRKNRIWRFGQRMGYFPGQQRIFESDGIVYINRWGGWNEREGNIEPFMDYLRATMPVQQADLDLFLNIIAYRMQRGEAHMPFGIVLQGDVNAANNICDAISAAFSPYHVNITSINLFRTDRRWMQMHSLATLKDAKQVINKHTTAELLSSIISSPRALSSITDRGPHNTDQDYNRCLFLLTASMVSASEGHHARSMVLCTFPTRSVKGPVYDRFIDWLDDPASGPALANALLSRDLTSFSLGRNAPMTQYAHFVEHVTARPFTRIAREALNSDENLVALWISRALEWADMVINKEDARKVELDAARAVARNMPEMKISPWYTAEELRLILPEATAEYMANSANRRGVIDFVSADLIQGGLPLLLSADDHRGFLRHGRWENFFVIHDFERWTMPITQAEFDEARQSMPTYREYVRGGYAAKKTSGREAQSVSKARQGGGS